MTELYRYYGIQQSTVSGSHDAGLRVG